jgi:hypothetical protein
MNEVLEQFEVSRQLSRIEKRLGELVAVQTTPAIVRFAAVGGGIASILSVVVSIILAFVHVQGGL